MSFGNKQCVKCKRSLRVSAYAAPSATICLDCVKGVPPNSHPNPDTGNVIERFTAQLHDTIAKSSEEHEQQAPQFLEEAIEAAGGRFALARAIGGEWKRAFDERVSDEDKKKLGYHPSLRHKIAADITKALFKRDESIGKTDLSSASEDDILKTLMTAAGRMLQENPAFLRDVVFRELNVNQKFRAEMEEVLRQPSKTIVKAIEHDEEPDPDYTESV